MKPVDQTITEFKNGDCMRACIASIFELPLEEVPNFMRDGPDDFAEHLNEWCDKMGLRAVDIRLDDPSQERETLKGCYVIAVGKSPRATKDWHRHAVVWLNGQMIHDPHPTQKVGFMDGQPEMFSIFIMKNCARSGLPLLANGAVRAGD